MSNNFHSGYSWICFCHCCATCTHSVTVVFSGQRKRPKCFQDSGGSCIPAGRPVHQKWLLHCAWLCKCGRISLYQATSQVSMATTMSPWLCEIFSHFVSHAEHSVKCSDKCLVLVLEKRSKRSGVVLCQSKVVSHSPSIHAGCMERVLEGCLSLSHLGLSYVN